MKAAVVVSFEEPLAVQEGPLPEPGEGQIQVRIEASGLCHTDIHAARGDWPVKPTPPFVPGHEGVGIGDSVRSSGTANLRHRAERRGGTVTLVPGKPSGTCLEWRVPI